MVLKKCSKKFNQILGLMKKEGKLIKKKIVMKYEIQLLFERWHSLILMCKFVNYG